jgi:hypothetical protein
VKEREKIAKAEAMEMERIARNMNRAIDRETRRNQRIADAGALRVSGGAVRNMGGMVQRGVGVASDIARGAGIDFSIGNAVKRRFDLQTSAIDLTNAAYMPGQKDDKGKATAASVRQDPRAIMAEA